MARRVILLILMASGWCSASEPSIHFELRHGYLIVVQCSIGNVPHLTAILDTGTNQTVLDSRVVKRLALTTKADYATFISHDAAVLTVDVPSIALGPIQSRPLSVISTDLSGFSAIAGVPIDVVIGMDLLGSSDFLIDYEARVLRFAGVSALRHHASMKTRAGLVTVSMTGLAFPLQLLVDTGFSRLLLFKRQLGEGVDAHEATLKLATLAKNESLQEFDSPLIRVGDWQGAHQRLLIVDNGREKQTEFDGLLGPRFLGARRIGFDFSRQTLWWE